MVTLNDYLYSGSTIFRILNNYIRDLRKDAKVNHNEIDLVHSNFLIHIQEMLEHNDFLTAQSQKIREFYRYMAKEYPFLAFTFRGRIKSLIRAEEKFNGYIVEYIYDYYEKYGSYPSVAQLKDRLSCFGILLLIVLSFRYRNVIRIRGRQEKTGIRVSISDCQYSAGVSGRTWIYCGACQRESWRVLHRF